MAFPVVESLLTQQYSGASTDGMSVDMPASVSAGSLLLVFLTSLDANTFATPTGWSAVYNDNNGDRFASSLFARVADGSEGGTSVFFDAKNAQGDDSQSISSAAAQVYEISAWSGTISEIEDAINTSSLGSSKDCPALSPSPGAQDYLWLVSCHAIDDDADVTGAPTNYTNLTSTVSGAGTNSGGTIGTARRKNNTGTEDPDAFTLSESERVTTYTISIPPGSGGGVSDDATGDPDDVLHRNVATTASPDDVAQSHSLEQASGSVETVDATGDPIDVRHRNSINGDPETLTHTQSLDQIRFSQPQSLSHGHSLGKIVLETASEGWPESTWHAHGVHSTSTVEASTIGSPNGLSHGHSIDTVVVSGGSVIGSPGGLSHAHSIDPSGISAVGSPEDVAHTQALSAAQRGLIHMVGTSRSYQRESSVRTQPVLIIDSKRPLVVYQVSVENNALTVTEV